MDTGMRENAEEHEITAIAARARVSRLLETSTTLYIHSTECSSEVTAMRCIVCY
jgi:hypothetical protein